MQTFYLDPLASGICLVSNPIGYMQTKSCRCQAGYHAYWFQIPQGICKQTLKTVFHFEFRQSFKSHRVYANMRALLDSAGADGRFKSHRVYANGRASQSAYADYAGVSNPIGYMQTGGLKNMGSKENQCFKSHRVYANHGWEN